MNQSRIKCPYCGEEIAATAKKCRFCNEWLPTSPAPAPPQMQQPQQPAYQQPIYRHNPYQQSANRQTSFQQSQSQQTFSQQTYCQQPGYQQTNYQQPVYQHFQSQGARTPYLEPDDITTSNLVDVVADFPSVFETYFVVPFIRHYKDFSGFTGRKSFWLSMLALLIINLGITGLALLIIALSGMAPGGLLAAGILIAVWSLALIVPSIAIGCRRLRDAGKSPMLYLLCLIPLIGPIILLIFWCKESQYDHSDENTSFKPVDIVVTAISVVLFAGGIIALTDSFGGLSSGTDENDMEAYVVDYVDYDGSDTISERSVYEYALSEADADDSSDMIINSETDSEFGFTDGMNYFDGNMISAKGTRFPIKVSFYYDASTRKYSNVVYKNVKYGTTLNLIGYENTDGGITLQGGDGGKQFVMQFSGNGTYTGDAWWGDTHQDLELFKL